MTPTEQTFLNVRGTKTTRSRRAVPVPLRAQEALDELPAQLASRLLFPSPQKAVYALGNFRTREFDWAVEAAGLAVGTCGHLSSDCTCEEFKRSPLSPTPYTLRHSGLSWALASGIPAVDVARFGGTSLAMLERHYHHLLVGSIEIARARLDAFAAQQDAEAEVVDGV